MGPPLSRGLRGRCGIRAERSGCSAPSTPPSVSKNKEKMTTGTRSRTDHRSDRQSILDELESGGRAPRNLRARTEAGEVGRLGESSEGGHRMGSVIFPNEGIRLGNSRGVQTVLLFFRLSRCGTWRIECGQQRIRLFESKHRDLAAVCTKACCCLFLWVQGSAVVHIAGFGLCSSNFAETKVLLWV
ncbi:hypothetical protein B296_00003918 [Ensete ventricosum]|uniref:Uncharacterized protein n=1 Tax=Ensete ventricosum TaxID=4639 RepID=A0A427AZX3_ENSVE|nr:hypothetical protein B296_00003918 [Ensete ventricosum]